MANVYDSCPADRAGLKVGDLVVEVAGEAVDGLADLFRKVWRIGPAGCRIPLTIIQEGISARWCWNRSTGMLG